MVCRSSVTPSRLWRVLAAAATVMYGAQSFAGPFDGGSNENRSNSSRSHSHTLVADDFEPATAGCDYFRVDVRQMHNVQNRRPRLQVQGGGILPD